MRLIEATGSEIGVGGLVIAAVGTIAPEAKGIMRGPGVGFTGFTVFASPKAVDGGTSTGITLEVR